MSIADVAIRRVIAPLWAKREKSTYLELLHEVETMQHRPLATIHDDHLRLLQALVGHALQNSPYYQQKFFEYGIGPESIENLSDLQRLPLLTKNDIRANKEHMVARNISKKELVEKKTSGSTGVSVELFVDEKSSQWKRAVTVAYDRWTGWDIGMRVGAIWGNPEGYQNWRLYLRNLLLTRHIFLDTLQMSETKMLSYHATLVRKKPVILFGHAHSLFLFARFMEQNGLSDVHPKGIISTCMVLHDFERKTIEQVFGCRVTNRYGCEEVSLIACECPQGNMHLNSSSLIVEFVRDGKAAKPGEPGSIVVTDLTNYGMPMIRYKVGDVGVPSTKVSCSCGCNYPIMESLQGRVADYVVTPDGQYISGISLTENFAMHLSGVKQMQIVQETVQSLLFRIVKGELFSEKTVVDLKNLAFAIFGSRMNFTVEYVDSIQSETSGKYRFCISKVNNPFT